MKCPIDEAELVMTERQGVEIDYCPTCRGVWLDRGELDKILDRALETAPASASPGTAPTPTTNPVAPAVGGIPPAAMDPYRDPRVEGYRGDDRYKDDRYRDDRYRDDRSRDDRYRTDSHGRPYRKKKESWLGEIFDF